METKFDSRQGQFPATFPDTFKDFFAMMSEDEDHLDLFSNLLEDKVIPRTNKHNQRRCGGSLRCTNTTATATTTATNFGRSNSFRVNRPVTNYCKHIKYCCLHQKQYPQNFIEFGYGSPNDDDDNNILSRIENQKNKNSNRPSVLDRTFECESCEDSDTISTTSSTATIPYNAISNRPQNKAFHSKETLPRIVQQCGLRDGINTGNIIGNSIGGGSLGGSCTGTGNVNGGNTSGTNTNSAILSGGRSTTTLYTDVQTTTATSVSMSNTPVSMTKCFSDKLNCCSRTSVNVNIRSQKSPVMNRRRSSSIVATLMATDNKIFRNADDPPPAWTHNIPHSNTRERLSHTKSPVNTAGIHSTSVKGKSSISESGGVLTLKQAMSGAMSPQYTPTSSTLTNFPGSMACSSTMAITPTVGGQITSSSTSTINKGDVLFTGSMAQQQQRQRVRTSSMPAESRKPRLADTRRAAIHCADMDIEYYRLRSFSITSHGICNLGDSMRSRRSRSINSVTSTGTSNSGRDRNNSNASRISGGDVMMENEQCDGGGNVGNSGDNSSIPAYKIAILGASGVGKTALTYQFTTSDYICAYDLSLDDDYGQKTVSVLVDGMETDLEIIDHPACEMSTESFCSTYNIDLFVVVYSVVDRNTFKSAEKILQYLKESEMLMTRGAILVGNKTDLERHREVPRQTGRRLAKEIQCKFIETSSGLDHNVNELLVGIVAQVKLNPKRIRNLTEKERQRLTLNSTIQKHRRIELPTRKIIKQKSICKDYDSKPNRIGPINKTNNSKIITMATAPTKRILNLENILKVSESEIDDEDDNNEDDIDDDDGYRSEYTTIKKKSLSRYRKINNKLQYNSSSETPSCSSSPKPQNSYDIQENVTNLLGDSPSPPAHQQNQQQQQQPSSSLSPGKEKTVSKLTNRTKIFLTSVLKFKKNLNVKRRNSSSCSDLFVI